MSFHQQQHRLIWRKGRETLQIEAWGPDALRVRGTVNPPLFSDNDPLSALLSPAPATPFPEISIGEDVARICNGELVAEINDEGVIRFLKAATGEEVLAEWWPRLSSSRYRFKPALEGDHFRVQMRFKAYEGERLFGLGQHRHALLDVKGAVIDLLQDNGEVSIPFLLSNRGYGFLWNNPAVGRVELGRNHTRWIAESTRKLDYWMTLGETPAQILHRYVDATGHAPMMPAWATGFWQCKLRYKTQAELLAIAREYKARGLPLSVIVIDFLHWTLMGEWRFNPDDWPDPAGMVRELEEMGVKVKVSVWPTINLASPNYQEAKERGLLVETNRGLPATLIMTDNNALGQPVALAHYDSTNPEARAWLWEHIREGYYQHGIKIFWLDADEPEIKPFDPENLRYYLGNGLAVSNIYPLMHARTFYEGLRAEGEEEILTFNRSAWAGSQRYGAAVWSGDIPSTFEVLQAQVRAGLSIGLSGIPWWTSDIGGFYDGDPQDPAFRELIVRWFQFGTFSPLFRLHGLRKPGDIDRFWEDSGPNEVWSFGDEAYKIIREFLYMRERLRPYIMELMAQAQATGAPPMRPLFFDFPTDEQAWAVEDAYMFGPALLVAPILFKGARSREVYLPAGVTWRDAWTDEVYAGGQRIIADAPLERIPLYLAGDARLPIRDEKRSSSVAKA